jgi:hypothetical protein
MPKLQDDSSMQNHSITGSFGYSAIGMNKLGATEYTLVTVVQDISGSIQGWERDMEKALKEIIHACQTSPRADNLMVRLVTFSDQAAEVHGFKLLQDCNAADYDNILNGSGMTAMFDAAYNAIAAEVDFGKQLTGNEFASNCIEYIITDGCDNRSSATPKMIKDQASMSAKGESM